MARFVGDELVTVGLRSAVAVMRRHSRDGELIGEVDLGEPCSIEGFDVEGADVVLQLASFTRPSHLARWTPGGPIRVSTTSSLPFDPADLSVRLSSYRSLDGTEIGLFLVHRADQTLSPETPAILTGYGGFALAESPAYGAGVVAWCEAGGLYAIAGLRGGSEHGDAWHHAGRRANKQNVFDDFHAAADHLVASGVTSRDRLAVRGGSNGGLLMGAAITQRPDLAKAVVCQVPLLDMVRFPRFLIARLWTSEYGDPDVADEFAWLWAYSPYHHVHDGVRYPPVLLTTATGEGRVHPSHALKMAAALQHASVDEPARPVLLRVEDRAGHGVGKPLGKQADELADILTFCAWQLGGPRPAAS
jgi:prolyl oligopeptidase